MIAGIARTIASRISAPKRCQKPARGPDGPGCGLHLAVRDGRRLAGRARSGSVGGWLDRSDMSHSSRGSTARGPRQVSNSTPARACPASPAVSPARPSRAPGPRGTARTGSPREPRRRARHALGERARELPAGGGGEVQRRSRKLRTAASSSGVTADTSQLPRSAPVLARRRDDGPAPARLARDDGAGREVPEALVVARERGSRRSPARRTAAGPRPAAGGCAPRWPAGRPAAPSAMHDPQPERPLARACGRAARTSNSTS